MPSKLSIEDMRNLARTFGGSCLSKRYKGVNQKLIWKCAQGHVWKTTPALIKFTGTRCPECAIKTNSNRLRSGIAKMQMLAKSRGGSCLSEVYKNNQTPLKWKCEYGHIWEARPGNISTGQWCPNCAGRTKLSIEDYKKVARSNGGKLLSKKVSKNSELLVWQCKEGHKWAATGGSVRSGTWCRSCAYKRLSKLKLGSLSEFQEIAKARGGQCLSESYLGGHSKLVWKCSQGHEWTATPSSVKAGTWCAECSSHTGEQLVRYAFEQIFRTSFPKERPKWMIGPNGLPLELDGYSKKMSLAFEHQGDQHYKETWMAAKQPLRERKRFDRLKREMCRKEGIKLIAIPALFSRTKLKSLKQVIIKSAERQGVKVPSSARKLEINFDKAYLPRNESLLQQYQALALKKGGKLNSKKYFTAKTSLEWQCSEGHVWKTAPMNIKRGSWCVKCLGRREISVGYLQKYAEEKGGELVSRKYRNNGIPLLWKCENGHSWKAKPSNILMGKWCPRCAWARMANDRKDSIQTMYEIAKSRGGACLSKEYINAHSKLIWRCSAGHIWKATAASVKSNKSWCRKCILKQAGGPS